MQSKDWIDSSDKEEKNQQWQRNQMQKVAETMILWSKASTNAHSYG